MISYVFLSSVLVKQRLESTDTAPLWALSRCSLQDPASRVWVREQAVSGLTSYRCAGWPFAASKKLGACHVACHRHSFLILSSPLLAGGVCHRDVPLRHASDPANPGGHAARGLRRHQVLPIPRPLPALRPTGKSRWLRAQPPSTSGKPSTRRLHRRPIEGSLWPLLSIILFNA